MTNDKFKFLSYRRPWKLNAVTSHVTLLLLHTYLFLILQPCQSSTSSMQFSSQLLLLLLLLSPSQRKSDNLFCF